jgi:hypothetical protein
MADFTFGLHSMIQLGPSEYNVLSTKGEGWTVKTRLKSTRPARRWQVEIRGRTIAERDLILAHWDTQYGTLDYFNWIVPAFWGGETYVVYYETMDISNPENIGNIFEFSIVFKEAL